MKALLKKNYVLFVMLMVLLVGAILVWFGNSRLNEYIEYHHSIAKGAVSGVAVQVASFMQEQNRLVKVFASEHVEEITAIAAKPDNEQLRVQLGEAIQQYFPNHFAFTVADSEGNPYYEDFDGLVSEMCVGDMKGFAAEDHYDPYIHPNPAAYHFDIMAKFENGKKQGVLFISFHADVMGKILNSAQAPGHDVMLIYPKRNNIIEVVAAGARNHLIRDDYRLSDVESSRILEAHDVDGTRWQAIDLQQQNLFSDFRKRMVLESLVLFAFIVGIGILMVMRLAKEERQRELAEAMRDEAEKNRSALIGVIAHEFRTPVTAIIGSLMLLGKDLQGMSQNQALQLIGLATNNTNKLQRLIDDFLDLQRLEGSGLQFDKQTVDLVSLVKRSIENNSMYAMQFNTSICLDDAPDKVMVSVDEKRIEQVMTNLLSNAAKYGVSRKPISIMITVSGNVVRVSVKDHGPGIDPEFQPRVFDKFATAPRSGAQQVQSTGLGLSICKAIVEGHDGVIGFESEPDSGTCFYFELPFNAH